MTTLIRKRLIPAESITLKDDHIIYMEKDHIITRWKTFRPKPEFSHGISYYVLNQGWKISKFFKEDHSLAYIYCDIIDTSYDEATDTYIFTDLLADVIIEGEQVRVVDLDELGDACSEGLISNEMLVSSLHKLNRLLSVIYDGSFEEYLKVLDQYQ